MSFETKNHSVGQGGIRLAANDPHFVSLGGRRFSTAVTIHHIPIGHITIGSSSECDIILHGADIQPRHCIVYRSESGEITLSPEPGARLLVDGYDVDYDTNLTQGSMLTFGKSNYLRFNNPIEAKIIMMEHNEQAALNSKSTNGYNANELKEVDFTELNKIQMPKIFSADSVTVPTPARDVLGSKYNNFVLNNTNANTENGNNTITSNERPLKTNSTIKMNINHLGGQSKVQNSCSNGSPKVQSISACYDRYPKPGCYGTLQIFPMKNVNSEINGKFDGVNNELEKLFARRRRKDEEDVCKQEQERLDEILKMCADFERENKNVQHSPIVQNRIKTNGSLPRDKKIPDFPGQQRVFFPTTPDMVRKKSGYENVLLNNDNKIEIDGKPYNRSFSTTSSEGSCRSPAIPTDYDGVSSNGRSVVPQSPRSKIRTCPSPKKEKKLNEYDELLQTFENKLKTEFPKVDESPTRIINNGNREFKLPSPEIIKCSPEKMTNNSMNFSSDFFSTTDLEGRRTKIMDQIRNIKIEIDELQGHKEEVFRELDMEKALVSAELKSEYELLADMKYNLSTLQKNIHRLETQRNANRVIQETQQSKLKQSIDIKQNQVEGLEKLMAEDKANTTMQEELNRTYESLENDRKMFEDLEFQYLEEETEWLGNREELQCDLIALSRSIHEKQMEIEHLESQGLENNQSACVDTKSIETQLLLLYTDLEKHREELRSIDTHLRERSHDSSSSSSKTTTPNYYGNKIMSQSLFGSQEILSSKHDDGNLMSKSMNENMFLSSIEMPTSTNHLTSTPMKNKTVQRIAVRNSGDFTDNPLLKLKYNLSPPFEHSRSLNDSLDGSAGALNLSLGSDDFQVNPLEKRIPSQDDIDRICKVTTEAPISVQGASHKVKESIKEIEKNRQMLLAQQGSHVIEHERQKMNELKKKIQVEATAHYLLFRDDEKVSTEMNDCEKITTSATTPQETVNDVQTDTKFDDDNNKSTDENSSSSQRHSHPNIGLDQQGTELKSGHEFSETAINNAFRSVNDMRTTSQTNSIDNDYTNRSSFASQNELSDSNGGSQVNINPLVNSKLVSGSRRGLAKHQRPLTRYLPIFSPDLNLRQHIETAGHQIQLCPHVIIDAHSCKGYLHKLGGTFRGWSRRWFVLDRQRMALIYYSDKSERKPRGGAYFTTIDEVYLDHLNTSKSGRPNCTFIVKTKKRRYHLMAASDAAARIWIDAIITGAQGNIDY